MRSTLAPIAIALLACITPALAAEPTGSLMGDAFLRTLEANGYENARAARAVRENGMLTLTGVEATAADGPALSIAQVEVTAPAINADEALNARRIVYTTVRLAEPNRPGATTIAAVTLDNPVLPTAQADTSRLSNLAGSFDRLALTGLTTPAGSGNTPAGTLTVGGLALTRSAPDNPNLTGGRLVIDRLAFGTNVLDSDAAEQLAALGIEQLSLDFVGEGQWRKDTGSLVLDTATFRAAELGTLAIAAEIEGVTEASLARLSASISNLGELLSALDAASVSSLSLAYVDEGLAPKLLAQAAERTGTTVPALNAELIQALRAGLQPLGDPAFAASVERAVSRFLADPGRIGVSAAPRETITLAQVIGVALLRPEVLPTLLNITIQSAP